MKRTLFVLFVICILVTACSGGQDASPLAGSWRLVSYGPISKQTPTLPDIDGELIFNAGKVSGNVGCNSFRGTYTVAGDKITFSPMLSTMMACVPEVIMTQEKATLRVITGSVSFKIAGKYLTITNGTESLILDGSIP